MAPAGTTGSLEGTVRDKTTNEILIGANILIVTTELGAASDLDGFYSVQNIPAGTYDIRCTYVGYQTLVVHDVRIKPDLKTKLDIGLTSGEVEFQAVEITAVRPPIQKDVTGTLHTATTEVFTLLPVTGVGEVVGLQPGVTLENNIRGGKTTEVAYLVDGLPVQNLIEGGSGSDLPQSSISELAVQTGGFDAEYGNALSGVVNVITKRGGDTHSGAVRAETDDFWGGEQVDHRNEIDLSASGPVPIVPGLFYFGSVDFVQTDTRWWQDLSRFFSSPIARNYSGFARVDYNASSSLRLGGQLLFSFKDWHDYEYTWRFNLDGLPPREQTGYRVAAIISHTISESFFYNASLSRYAVDSEIGDGSASSVDTSLYQWDFFQQYIVEGNRSWWARGSQINNLLKADFTWRFDEHHLVKFGGELSLLEVSSDVVRYEPYLNPFGKPFVNKPLLNYSTDYEYFPRTGSAYLQDKIELSREGMLLNLGLRFEFLDPRAERPVAERVPNQDEQYETTIVGTVPASVKTLWSPRIGFAAPFAEHGYLFINYGQYYQFPLFDYLYSGLNNVSLKKGVGVLVGNPDLRPEGTRAWEMSMKYALKNGLVLSGTYFNKETTNQIDVKTFVPTNASVAGDYGFAEFVNNPFATASGIELMVSKDSGEPLTGSVSYTFMNAEGLSEDAREGLDYYQWGIPVPARPFPLSWDQQHTVKVIGALLLPLDFGLSWTWEFHTGRPYTYYPSDDGFTPRDPGQEFEPNNARLDDFNLLNVKLTRGFEIGSDASPWMHLDLYLDGRNVLNTKNVRWVDSSGRVGGELGDLSAWDQGRRVRLGVRMEL
jgi:outer membrane receptor protein involved in Fe transport